MANWCSTTLGIKAETKDAEAVAQLEVLRTLAESVIHQKADNCDAGWIGLLLKNQGINPRGISCRGFIQYVSEIETAGTLSYILVDVEDAWTPQLGLWDKLLTMPAFNKLSYVVKAEESGCEIFINTDVDGDIFPERFILDYSAKTMNSSEIVSDYVLYESFQDLRDDCKELFGVDAADMKDLLDKLIAYTVIHEDDVEFINVHPFQIDN